MKLLPNNVIMKTASVINRKLSRLFRVILIKLRDRSRIGKTRVFPSMSKLSRSNARSMKKMLKLPALPLIWSKFAFITNL